MENMKDKIVAKYNIKGVGRATVWNNEKQLEDRLTVWRTASLQRNFKITDAEGKEEWKTETINLQMKDLPSIAAMLLKIYQENEVNVE